jgi:hypothetical protein
VSQRGPIFQLASAKIAAKNVAAQKDEKKFGQKNFVPKPFSKTSLLVFSKHNEAILK